MFRGIADTVGIWLLYIVLNTNDVLYGILFVRLFYIGHIFLLLLSRTEARRTFNIKKPVSVPFI